METAVAKVNCDLLNCKVSGNSLEKKIEDLVTEKESLEEKIKNDVVFKKMKETYENEKWKNLADISNLRQQNEAFKVRFSEQETEAKKFLVDFKEYEKLKKENIDLKKDLDESKKNRQINALRRKLIKAETQIRKLYKQINTDQDLIFPIEEPEENLTLEKILSSAMQPTEPVRFPILMFGNQYLKKKNKVRFLKQGDISFCEPPDAYAHKPSISFSDFKSNTTQDKNSFKILDNEEIQFLEELIESVSLKRKRPQSAHPKTGITPTGKKRWKRDQSSHLSKNAHTFSTIKIMSPDRINSMQIIHNNMSSMDTDSEHDEDICVDSMEGGGLGLPTIYSTSSLATSNSANSLGNLPTKVKRPSPKKSVTEERLEVRRTPATNSSLVQLGGNIQDQGSSFSNPNPSKVRRAHGQPVGSITMNRKPKVKSDVAVSFEQTSVSVRPVNGAVPEETRKLSGGTGQTVQHTESKDQAKHGNEKINEVPEK